jgi:aldose 1-epimerase
MDFGVTPEGTPVDLFELSNGRMTVKVITYGAIVTEIHAPDRRGVAGRCRRER